MKYKTLLAFLQTLRARRVQVLAAKRSTVHPITRLLLMVCAITGTFLTYINFFFKSHFLLFKITFLCVCVQFGWEKKAWRSSDRSQGWWGCSVTSLAGYISGQQPSRTAQQRSPWADICPGHSSRHLYQVTSSATAGTLQEIQGLRHHPYPSTPPTAQAVDSRAPAPRPLGSTSPMTWTKSMNQKVGHSYTILISVRNKLVSMSG